MRVSHDKICHIFGPFFVVRCGTPRESVLYEGPKVVAELGFSWYNFVVHARVRGKASEAVVIQ